MTGDCFYGIISFLFNACHQGFLGLNLLLKDRNCADISTPSPTKKGERSFSIRRDFPMPPRALAVSRSVGQKMVT